MDIKVGSFSIIGFRPEYHVYNKIPILLDLDKNSFFLRLSLPVDTRFFDYMENHLEFPIIDFKKSLKKILKFAKIEISKSPERLLLNSKLEIYTTSTYPHWVILIRFNRKNKNDFQPINLEINNLNIKLDIDNNEISKTIDRILTNIL